MDFIFKIEDQDNYFLKIRLQNRISWVNLPQPLIQLKKNLNRENVFNVSIVWPNYSLQFTIIHFTNYKIHYGNINLYLFNWVKILPQWIILIGTRGKKVIALTPFLTQLDFIFIIENFLVSIRFLSFSPSIESLRQKKTCKNQFTWSIP